MRTAIRVKRKAELLPLSLPSQSHCRPVEERRAAGKALRERCARELHAKWKAPKSRRDPIKILIESSAGRVKELLPIRYGRMMASPFAFYRGAASIMASDLAPTPANGINVQACGDCHLVNFGGFATPERKIVFDINDFDETSVAPWEWDVKRLAASFVVAGRANGFKESDCRKAAWTAARTYREKMAAYAGMPLLQTWYEQIDLEKLILSSDDEQMKRFNLGLVRKAAEGSSHEKEFAKLAFQKGEQPRIKDEPPLIYHVPETKSKEFYKIAVATFRRYIQTLPPERRVLLDRFQIADIAYKVVGVGSVGTLCGIVLLMAGNGDPLFLQFKEARQSVLEPHAGGSPYKHRGERVVRGQRLMQASSDIFLGWATGAGAQARHFYFRQLRDAKIKPVVEVMKPKNLRNYAVCCGWALARAHARSTDAVTLAAYLGKSDAFEDALAAFASAYADQNERDHAALRAAVRAGRVEAVTEQA
ncbi:MAG TPA: DUF2252 domain-containing protein [bacterium]|nr:DUF2252 domain-containing protein [bacterium]